MIFKILSSYINNENCLRKRLYLSLGGRLLMGTVEKPLHVELERVRDGDDYAMNVVFTNSAGARFDCLAQDLRGSVAGITTTVVSISYAEEKPAGVILEFQANLENQNPAWPARLCAA